VKAHFQTAVFYIMYSTHSVTEKSEAF